MSSEFWNNSRILFDSDPYSTSKVIHQRRSTARNGCGRAMVNNFAPRGARSVIKLICGAAGPAAMPSKDDEYSDLAGLTAQARLSLSGRRLVLKRILEMPMYNVSPIRISPVPSLHGCLAESKGTI